MPYTYLIGWKSLDRWYYGVRFAKNARPEDLFCTYFTSSKYVQNFHKENGPPDVIQIRKTFTDIDEARNWETKVLTRLKVTKNEKWLNKTTNLSISLECLTHKDSAETRQKKSLSRIGKRHSEETKKKMGESHIGRSYYWLNGVKKPAHSIRMQGAKNSNAKKVIFEGEIFDTMQEFSQIANLSFYKIRKLASEGKLSFA